MKKSFRQKLVSVFIFLAVFSFLLFPNTTLQAQDNNDYTYYEELVEKGVLGEDITFEMWQELVTESKLIEKAFEDSENFTLVRKFTNDNSDTLMGLPTDPNVPVIHDGGSGSDFRAGDIFITNATFGQLTGHSGIMMTNGNILHIAGIGETPDPISVSNWHRNYTNAKSNSWTKVYRCVNGTAGIKAANWAYNTYYNSGAKYTITNNLASTNETYCSKLVWQAYYYGAGKSYVTDTIIYRVVFPYSLPNEISVYHKYTFAR